VSWCHWCSTGCACRMPHSDCSSYLYSRSLKYLPGCPMTDSTLDCPRTCPPWSHSRLSSPKSCRSNACEAHAAWGCSDTARGLQKSFCGCVGKCPSSFDSL
jgi:hypothetical protein